MRDQGAEKPFRGDPAAGGAGDHSTSSSVAFSTGFGSRSPAKCRAPAATIGAARAIPLASIRRRNAGIAYAIPMPIASPIPPWDPDRGASSARKKCVSAECRGGLLAGRTRSRIRSRGSNRLRHPRASAARWRGHRVIGLPVVISHQGGIDEGDPPRPHHALTRVQGTVTGCAPSKTCGPGPASEIGPWP